MNKKSLIRYLTIIIDFSKFSLKQDYRPNRATVIKEYIKDFLNDFFDINPLSKVSVITIIKERAILISTFSNSKKEAIVNLNGINEFEGCPSYQNALELALV